MGLPKEKESRTRYKGFYLKPSNAAWLEDVANEKGYSHSELLDLWIESERLNDPSPMDNRPRKDKK